MKRLITYIFFLFILAHYSYAFSPTFIQAIGDLGATDYTADANCMGAWYMNSVGDATEVDRSGEGMDLEEGVADTIPRSATVPSGYSGYSKDFESGDGDQLERTESDGNALDIYGADQAISFGCWVRAESDTGADMEIMNKYNNASGKRQYRLQMDHGNSAFQCTLSSTGDDDTSAHGATDVSVGNWQHVFCVYNDTDIRIYVNGSLDSHGADNPKTYSSGIFNGSEDFQIGMEVGSAYWDGLIDECIIFNRALSAAEVSDIHTNGISGNKGAND